MEYIILIILVVMFFLDDKNKQLKEYHKKLGLNPDEKNYTGMNEECRCFRNKGKCPIHNNK